MSAGNAMRLKWCQDAEADLGPTRAAVWKAVHALLPAGHPFVGTDYGLEIFLLAQIQRGAVVEDLMRYIPGRVERGADRRHAADRRMLASGEAA